MKDYSLSSHEHINTDFKHLVLPAYQDEIDKLKRGPFSLSASDESKFNDKIQEIIENDFHKVEPYVDKLFNYISANYLCVIVLDNVDLYENPELEISVFSEGIALGKKLKSNIIMSIRDTTYVKHKNDSIFNAYELKKFWIDPPPFREVLARRLKYAGLVLKGRKATIPYLGMYLTIEDLSIFFDIANSTLLSETSAKFIESIADGNIRKGISLVSNFLTSGHIQADRAFYNYINKEVLKSLPFHEVFKGTVLGQWKFYREARAEVINILNSGFNSKQTQLLRLYLLEFLFKRARDKNTTETPIRFLYETFSHLGASENYVNNCLEIFQKNGLAHTTDSLDIHSKSVLFITASGAYYYTNLVRQFEYVETVLFDTPIFSEEVWEEISALTYDIDHSANIVTRVESRIARVESFLNYLRDLEVSTLESTPLGYMAVIPDIEAAIRKRFPVILKGAKTYYGATGRI